MIDMPQISKEKNGSKGFVFTVDSMFALVSISLLAFVYLIVSNAHFEVQRYSGLENAARDYLRLNYQENVNVDGQTFNSLTGFKIIGFVTDYNFDFDTADDASAFTPRNGTWAWDSPGKFYKQTSNQGERFQSLVGDWSWTDYYVESTVRFSTQSGNDALAGVGLRASPAGARYTCVLNGNNKLTLWKLDDWTRSMDWSGNPFKAKADLGFSLVSGSSYTLWINATGNLINCGLKTVPAVVLSFPDPSPLISGKASLEAMKSGGQNDFDDVIIKGYDTSSNSTVVLRSVLYAYPIPCDCKHTLGCEVKKDATCLFFPEDLNNSMKEVWVA